MGSASASSDRSLNPPPNNHAKSIPSSHCEIYPSTPPRFLSRCPHSPPVQLFAPPLHPDRFLTSIIHPFLQHRVGQSPQHSSCNPERTCMNKFLSRKLPSRKRHHRAFRTRLASVLPTSTMWKRCNHSSDLLHILC